MGGRGGRSIRRNVYAKEERTFERGRKKEKEREGKKWVKRRLMRGDRQHGQEERKVRND